MQFLVKAGEEPGKTVIKSLGPSSSRYWWCLIMAGGEYMPNVMIYHGPEK